MTPREEQARFFGKVGTLVGAGVPLLPALEKAAAGIWMPALADAIGRIVRRAYGGLSLTDAFEAEAALFSPEVLALLEHGERMGDIDRKAEAISEGLGRGVLDAPRPPDTETEGGLLATLADAGEPEALLERGAGGCTLRVRGESGFRTRDLPEGHSVDAVLAEVEGRIGAGSFRGKSLTIRRVARRDGVEYAIRWGEAESSGVSLPTDAERFTQAESGLVLVAGLPGRDREAAVDALLGRVAERAGRAGRLGGGAGRVVPGVADYDAGTLLAWPDLAHLPVVSVPEPTTAPEWTAILGAAHSGVLVVTPVTRPDAPAALALIAEFAPPKDAFRSALVGVVVVPAGGGDLMAVPAEDLVSGRS